MKIKNINKYLMKDTMKERLGMMLHYDAIKMEMGHFIRYVENLSSIHEFSLNDV